MLKIDLVEPDRRHQPCCHVRHRLLRPVGQRARILEPVEADSVFVHDRVRDADRGHGAAVHEPLERDQSPAQQLLGDQVPEAGAAGGRQHLCQPLVGVHSIGMLRQVALHRLDEEGIGQWRPVGRPQGVDRVEAGRRLGHDLGLDAPRHELVVATHERLIPWSGQAQPVGHDHRQRGGRVARSEHAVQARALLEHQIESGKQTRVSQVEDVPASWGDHEQSFHRHQVLRTSGSLHVPIPVPQSPSRRSAGER